MNFKSKIFRSMALMMALNMLQWTFFPTLSWALTQSGTQPEFSSYEAVSTTDMVNLATGDFTYNMSILTVPGPEGSFSLPLSYHGGIGPEQEASWVGLGWNINPGALSRNLNQYPDDAKGDVNSNKDLSVVTNSGTGPSFWDDNYLFYHRNWDSEKGHGGTLSILGIVNLGWKADASFDVLGLVGASEDEYHVLGITFGDEGPSTSIDAMVQVAMTIGTFIGTAGAGEALIASERAGASATKAMGRVFDVVSGIGLPTLQAAIAKPNYAQGYMGWYLKTWKHKRRTHGIYLLDQNRSEEMYGALYLGDAQSSGIQNAAYNLCDGTHIECNRLSSPISSNTYPMVFNTNDNQQACSDMYTYVNTDYYQNTQPTHIAYDGFSVMGPAISGSIQPYRLETGSLSFPRQMSSGHKKFNPIPFLKNTGSDAVYKVNFRYEGEYSNHNDYQKGRPTDSDLFGIDHSYNDLGSNSGLFYHVNDPTLYDPTQRLEGDRPGLKSNRLVTGKNIEWFTNQEIVNGTPMQKGLFMDFLSSSGSLRSDFRNGVTAPYAPDGIGGYAITAEDGTTYHYALPVFNKVQYAYTNSGGITSSMQMNSPYAITWLLTGITGADFVDRGEIGVIDPADWGYWVKLEYGRFASNYHWRNPYWNYESNNSQGLKETYYLNTIKTRSHTAIFVKSLRQDGRAAYAKDPNNTTWSPYNYNDANPSSSLKLDSIILLNNDDYNELVNNQTYNLKVDANTINGVAYTVNGDTYNNIFDAGDFNAASKSYVSAHQLKQVAFNYDYSLCAGTYNSFSDASAPPHTDPHTDPSSRSGKLTLTSVSMLGRNGVRLFPDYKFDYDQLNNNPSYTDHNMDSWGMYKSDDIINSDGISFSLKSLFDRDGSAWSLKKITTPLGGTVEVSYERDNYNSIKGSAINYGYQLTLESDGLTVTFPNNINFNEFYKGGIISIWASLIRHSSNYYDCYPPPGPIQNYPQTIDFPIQSISGNSVTVQRPDIVTAFGGNIYDPCIPDDPNHVPCDCSAPAVTGYTATLPLSKWGGDIRVSQITTSDGTNSYKVRYIYSKSGIANQTSSGVISKEPGTDDGLYDYPFTPVLYSKVTVLGGPLTTDDDFTEKIEYDFQTPTADIVTVTKPYEISPDPTLMPFNNYGGNMYLRKAKFIVDVKTEHIGRLNSIKKYDKNNTLLSQTVCNYSDSGWQGVLYEGSILSELVYHNPGGSVEEQHQRLFRTEKHYIPSYLSSVTATEKGLTNTMSNVVFDFYTGEVLEKEYKNALGITYRTTAVPAYERYTSMGPKSLDPRNKHMLSQKTAGYLYKNNGGWSTTSGTLSSVTNSDGSTTYTMDLGNFVLPATYRAGFWCGVYVYAPDPNDPNYPNPNNLIQVYITPQISSIALDRKSFTFNWGSGLTNPSSLGYVPMIPIKAAISTWSNDWTVRDMTNTTVGIFGDVSSNDNPSTPDIDESVYRKKATYAWNSTSVNSDGSYQNFVDYNWASGSQDAHWQKTWEATKYDQYSRLLESKDANQNCSSMKYGYNKFYQIISPINGSFQEATASGAEDQYDNYSGIHAFGGEVLQGSGNQDPSKVHTGEYSLRLDNSGEGFIYTAPIVSSENSGGFVVNKKYRASAWIYDNSNTSAKLYSIVEDNNGTAVTGTEVNVTTANTVLTAGSWKLVNLDITVPSYAGYILKIACSNPSSTSAYFDDFRLHPLNSPITCNIYDLSTGQLTHTLDGDNMYVRYEYDDHGRIKALYKETINGEKKKKEYYYNYAGDHQ